jgi:hypothetical protein
MKRPEQHEIREQLADALDPEGPVVLAPTAIDGVGILTYTDTEAEQHEFFVTLIPRVWMEGEDE